MGARAGAAGPPRFKARPGQRTLSESGLRHRSGELILKLRVRVGRRGSRLGLGVPGPRTKLGPAGQSGRVHPSSLRHHCTRAPAGHWAAIKRVTRIESHNVAQLAGGSASPVRRQRLASAAALATCPPAARGSESRPQTPRLSSQAPGRGRARLPSLSRYCPTAAPIPGR